MPLPLSTALVLVGGGSLVAWSVAFIAAVISSRPGPVYADPATSVLGTVRPAVVNLLVNGWQCDLNAARATLVDLTARGFLLVRHTAAEPVIEIRNPNPPNVTRYERRLLERLRAVSRGGGVGLGALPFESRRAAARWLRRFASEVSGDARARGVARVGVNTDFLTAMALPPALAFGGWTYLQAATDREFSGLAVFVAVLLVLHKIGTRLADRDRPTAAGRAEAAHWLGVRAHMRERHTEFAGMTLDHPVLGEPVGAYAVALGLSTMISEQVQLTPTRIRRVVTRRPAPRVRFPYRMRFCWGWGPGGCAVLAAGSLLGAGAVQTALRWPTSAPAWWAVAIGWLAVVGLTVLGSGMAALAFADLVGTRDHSGTVVLLDDHRSWLGRPTRLSVVAVADGRRDPVDAWVLPPDLARGLTLGSTVLVRVRPWTGRVCGVTLINRPDRGTDPAGERVAKA